MTVPSNISDINNLYTFCKYCRQITVNITASASPLQSLSKAFFFYVMHTRTHPIYMKKKKDITLKQFIVTKQHLPNKY